MPSLRPLDGLTITAGLCTVSAGTWEAEAEGRDTGGESDLLGTPGTVAGVDVGGWIGALPHAATTATIAIGVQTVRHTTRL